MARQKKITPRIQLYGEAPVIVPKTDPSATTDLVYVCEVDIFWRNKFWAKGTELLCKVEPADLHPRFIKQ